MKLALQIALCLLFAACGYEAGEPLGDGYLHVNTDAYNTWVVRGGKTVVDSNVTNALAIDDYIVGLRVRPQKFVSHRENEISSEYGFFVFDTSTGVLIQGLSQAEISQIFEENGWDYRELADATL